MELCCPDEGHGCTWILLLKQDWYGAMWFADYVKFVHHFRSWKDCCDNKSLIVIDEGETKHWVSDVPSALSQCHVWSSQRSHWTFPLGRMCWVHRTADLWPQGATQSKDSVYPILSVTWSQHKARKVMEENLLLVKAQNKKRTQKGLCSVLVLLVARAVTPALCAPFRTSLRRVTLC